MDVLEHVATQGTVCFLASGFGYLLGGDKLTIAQPGRVACTLFGISVIGTVMTLQDRNKDKSNVEVRAKFCGSWTLCGALGAMSTYFV